MTCRLAASTILALMGLASSALAAPRFEVASWVDHYDFTGVKADGKYVFDTETPEGCAKILDHVQEVGTTTILWRNCGGATIRYQSREDAGHHATIPDKRRLPNNVDPGGWVRYGEADPDILRTALQMCRERGLKPGVHWPFEETHWASWTAGGFNLDHPQFWAQDVSGQPWWGRTSLAFPEVMAHKLRLVDELVDRGIETLFIDFFRMGGWGAAYEYVAPMREAFQKRYGEPAPMSSSDPRWRALVSDQVTDFLKAIRQRFDASGRKIDLMVGIPGIAPLDNQWAAAQPTDWRRWIDEGIIDGLVINYVCWDAADPIGSTKKLCNDVMKVARGRCRVYWPIRAYDYSGYGLPSYQKATKRSQADLAAELMEMAWEQGAAGVSLECVDYNNYVPATRQAMKALAEGKCKYVNEPATQ